MNNRRTLVVLFILLISSTFTQAATSDTVVVDVNLDVKHSVGGISTFDRSKFVTIHSDATEQEWNSGNNAVDDFMDDFLNGYDVYMGRNTGGITWNLNNNTTEDQNRSGFADSSNVAQNGQNSRNSYAAKTNLHPFETRNDLVMCAQLHPFWPDGKETNKGWALSQTDTEAEPFGTATGEYMGRYIRDFFGTGGTTGQPRSNFVEVVNEPLWHLVDYGDEEPEKVFRFHNAVNKEIKKLNPNIEVGGYCPAFPDVEKNNFQEWEERWKLFMDVSGENMDFWSIHLYDFPAIGGKQRYRKGAQMEATLDMIEHYSYLKFGEAKPFLVSEFGASSHDYFDQWSPFRDWLHMKSANTMMMQFMDRPNLISKTINYIMLKAEWGYDASTGKTWNHRLMRKANEPESYTGVWVYSDMVKMFQLWSDVKGTRIDSKANNLDILSDSYVDGNKVYVIVNSLDLENSNEINVNLLGPQVDVQSLKIRQQLLVGQQSEMIENSYTELPETVEIAPEGTLILEYTLSQEIQTNETSDETKFYATEYYKPIVGNQTLFFNINDVEIGQFGEATLRIGVGRDLNRERFPEVKINGTVLKVDENYRGDDQSERPSFFGVLEIDVPYNLLQKNNNISIKFPDTGGYVSSVTMQAYKFSREIKRFENPITGISSLNKSDIKIYPNPASNQIEIQSAINTANQNIEIYTLDGKKVLSKKLTTFKQNIDINVLKNGIYLLLFDTGNNVHSHKLVVNK